MNKGDGLLFGIGGVLLTIAMLVLNLLFYGALVAIVLYVALRMLRHFDVLMVGLALL